MYYLAGDVGGTKTLLQLSYQSSDSSDLEAIYQQRFECAEFESLEAIIQQFLLNADLQDKKIAKATFGLPGPVSVASKVVELTNLPWIVDSESLSEKCNIAQVSFINDFHAAALGIDAIKKSDLLTLFDGQASAEKQFDKTGNRLVIGAGTGLGVAPVYFDGQAYQPQSSEGGHFDFAPISETQQVLLNWLWQQWSHVSYERLLSGVGLETLYQFFQLYEIPPSFTQTSSKNLHKNTIFTKQNTELGLFVAERVVDHRIKSLSAPEIHALADSGDPVAEKAIAEFMTIYGAYAGAVALLWNSPSGVYLAGGIAGKLSEWIQKPYFLEAFFEKGRMTKLVKQTQVYLVMDEELGLKGAMSNNHR